LVKAQNPAVERFFRLGMECMRSLCLLCGISQKMTGNFIDGFAISFEVEFGCRKEG
jgi:hypothetical protein